MSLQNSGVEREILGSWVEIAIEVAILLIDNYSVRVLLGSGVFRIRLAGLTELLDVPADSLIAVAALLRFDTFSNGDADTVDETAVVILHGLQLVSQELHVVVVQLLVRTLVVMIVDELLQPANTYSKLPLLHTELFINFIWKHI